MPPRADPKRGRPDTGTSVDDDVEIGRRREAVIDGTDCRAEADEGRGHEHRVPMAQQAPVTATDVEEGRRTPPGRPHRHTRFTPTLPPGPIRSGAGSPNRHGNNRNRALMLPQAIGSGHPRLPRKAQPKLETLQVDEIRRRYPQRRQALPSPSQSLLRSEFHLRMTRIHASNTIHRLSRSNRNQENYAPALVLLQGQRRIPQQGQLQNPPRDSQQPITFPANQSVLHEGDPAEVPVPEPHRVYHVLSTLLLPFAVVFVI